jgi:hypothetical protein
MNFMTIINLIVIICVLYILYSIVKNIFSAMEFGIMSTFKPKWERVRKIPRWVEKQGHNALYDPHQYAVTGNQYVILKGKTFVYKYYEDGKCYKKLRRKKRR